METTAIMASEHLNLTNSTLLPSDPVTKRGIPELVFLVSVPFLCTIGLIGNSMGVILIQTNVQLKRLQSNAYLSASAVVSCVFLINLFLTWALPFIPDWNSKLMNPLYCKIVTFLAHWTDLACVWLIVAVSVDRMIILIFSGIRPQLRTLRFAHLMVVLIIILSLIMTSWTIVLAFPIMVEAWPKPRYYCLVKPNQQKLYSFFNSMDTVIAVIIPWGIILIMNLTILLKIRSYTRRKLILPPEQTSLFPNGYPTNHETALALTSPEVQKSRQKPSHSLLITPRFKKELEAPQGRKLHSHSLGLTPLLDRSLLETGEFRSRTRTSSSVLSPSQKVKHSDVELTKSLLMVTTAFVLLNLPSYLCRLLISRSPTETETIIWHLSYFLYYCHHAVLFFLYIFNSSQMRKQLKPTALKLLECYCLKTVPDFGHS